MPAIHSEADLDALRRAAQVVAIVGAWANAKVFDSLGDGNRHRLAELPGDERALMLTLPALANAGLVDAGDGDCAFSSTGLELYRAGALGPVVANVSITDLGRVEQALSDGRPVGATQIGVDTNRTEAAEAFLEMLWRRSERSAEETASRIAVRLRPGARVLDLGGGHGRYALALTDRGCAVTLFDLDLAIGVAARRAGDRILYRAGNFFTDDLGGPYDAILLSNIVHGLSADETRSLLIRVRASLSDQGLAVVKDLVLDDSRSGPEPAALFGLTMLLYTARGRTYTRGELIDLGKSARLIPAGHSDVPDCGFSLFFFERHAGEGP